MTHLGADLGRGASEWMGGRLNQIYQASSVSRRKFFQGQKQEGKDQSAVQVSAGTAKRNLGESRELTRGKSKSKMERDKPYLGRKQGGRRRQALCLVQKRSRKAFSSKGKGVERALDE